jgi:hypothetical protein
MAGTNTVGYMPQINSQCFGILMAKVEAFALSRSQTSLPQKLNSCCLWDLNGIEDRTLRFT